MTTVSVFGGTGFLGRRLVQRLATEGATVRVAVRHPEQAWSALGATSRDRVTVHRADVRDQGSVVATVAGADAVVNAVSAYVEKGDVSFEAIHERGAETIAREAREAGVTRLVLVSGLGADPNSASAYIRARGRGERLVQHAFPDATIVRPGAMFGPGDALFSTLADLARLLPVITRAIAEPRTAGRIYELAGPGVHTLRDLVGFALRISGRRRWLMPLPFVVANIQARLFEFLSSPLLTTSQVDLLKADNVASGALPGFAELNIAPKAIEEIVPTYIGRSRALMH